MSEVPHDSKARYELASAVIRRYVDGTLDLLERRPSFLGPPHVRESNLITQLAMEHRHFHPEAYSDETADPIVTAYFGFMREHVGTATTPLAGHNLPNYDEVLAKMGREIRLKITGH